MSIHFYPNNEDACRAVEHMLDDKGMDAAIYPTGSGKFMWFILN